MTPRQQELLAFIDRYVGERGIAPTVVEMGAATRASNGNIVDRLDRLQRQGLIRRTLGVQRSVEIVSPRLASTARSIGFIEGYNAAIRKIESDHPEAAAALRKRLRWAA